MSYGTLVYGTAVVVVPIPVPVPPTAASPSALAVFETPRVRDRPPYLPNSNHRQIGLWRHYENRLRGVSVWKRNNNTYCVDTPCNYEAAQTRPAAYLNDDPIGPDLTAEEPGLIDSNVSYPWNPHIWSTVNPVEGTYVYTTNWDLTTELFVLEPNLFEWFQGGAKNVISQFQALELTAAGFGDCISDYDPRLDPTLNASTYVPYSGGSSTRAPVSVGPNPPPPPPEPGFGIGPFGEEPFGG